MQKAVKVAEVRNDEMAAASKTGECQNGLPGGSGGNFAPRCWKWCIANNSVAALTSTEHRRSPPGTSLLSERSGL